MSCSFDEICSVKSSWASLKDNDLIWEKIEISSDFIILTGLFTRGHHVGDNVCRFLEEYKYDLKKKKKTSDSLSHNLFKSSLTASRRQTIEKYQIWRKEGRFFQCKKTEKQADNRDHLGKDKTDETWCEECGTKKKKKLEIHMHHSAPVQGLFTHAPCLARYPLEIKTHPTTMVWTWQALSAGCREQMASQMQGRFWPWAPLRAKHHRRPPAIPPFHRSMEPPLCSDSLWLFYLDEPYGAIMRAIV